MSDFKVGDEVEIIEGAYYGITTEGSKGIIKSIRGSRARIWFSYLASGEYGYKEEGETDTFTIHVENIKLSKTYSKEELVARKIATIYSRQRSRGIAHV